MKNNRKPIGTCRFCGSQLYKSDVDGYVFDCPECYEDFYLFEQYDDSRFESLWEEFGDVLIDYDNPDYPDGIIEEDWFIFEAGTDRMEIWHWFDEHYSKGVYKLMFKG